MSVSVNAPALNSIDVPIGTIVMWAVNSLPTGWLLCDGTKINKSNYPDLVKVLSGSDSVSSISLPDFRGLSPAGAGYNSNRGSSKNVKNGSLRLLETVGNRVVSMSKSFTINIPLVPHAHTTSIPLSGILNDRSTDGQPVDFSCASAGFGPFLFHNYQPGDPIKTTLNCATTSSGNGTQSSFTVSFSNIENVHPSIGINFIIKATS